MKNRLGGKKNGLILAAVFAGLAVILIGFSQAHAIKNQLNDWKLLPQPERLTELYFTHPNQLPSTYVPGGTQTVNFTVHNLEYRPTNYQYQIVGTSQDGTAKQVLSTGSFSLAQNQYARPSVSIVTPDLGVRAKVEVQLTTVNESIHYWVDRGSNG